MNKTDFIMDSLKRLEKANQLKQEVIRDYPYNATLLNQVNKVIFQIEKSLENYNENS